MKRLTMKDILEIAKRRTTIKPIRVEVPESIKKYDRIYVAQQRAKRLLRMY